MIWMLLVLGLAATGLWDEHRRRAQQFRELERELFARYGKEQIAGLTAREVYLLLRAGLLRPLDGRS